MGQATALGLQDAGIRIASACGNRQKPSDTALQRNP